MHTTKRLLTKLEKMPRGTTQYRIWSGIQEVVGDAWPVYGSIHHALDDLEFVTKRALRHHSKDVVSTELSILIYCYGGPVAQAWYGPRGGLHIKNVRGVKF